MDVDSQYIRAQAEHKDACLEYFEHVSSEIIAKIPGHRTSFKQVDLINPELDEENNKKEGDSDGYEIRVESCSEDEVDVIDIPVYDIEFYVLELVVELDLELADWLLGLFATVFQEF
jgi:hypothetical protein